MQPDTREARLEALEARLAAMEARLEAAEDRLTRCVTPDDLLWERAS